MVLVVDTPPELGAEGLAAALGPVAAAFDLDISVRPAAGAPTAGATDDEAGATRHTLTVYGADHPGIVHGVAQRLADRGANVVDLETHVIGPADRPVYAMVLDLALPAAVAAADLEADLAEVAQELGVSCTLRPADADIL
jgi:glycine cleavage system transcriptional repressor